MAVTHRPVASPQEDYRPILTFEAAGRGGLGGWVGGPAGTLFRDSAVVHGGRYAGRIERDSTSGGTASAFTLTLPVTFVGETLELHGWLRTEGVTGFAGLWLRQDGPAGPVQFDNMASRALAGTTEWTRYSIRLPLDARAQRVALGGLLGGVGTVWIDDLELLVDGAPAHEAPPLVRIPYPAESDREFDAGSRVENQPLSPTQVENLVLLGEVWGFVKYHHPRVAAGAINWDYELFRILPSVLNAPDRASARVRLSEWLARLGDPEPCAPCAAQRVDAQLLPELEWIRDPQRVGDELSARLDRIHRSRPANSEHYYVTHLPGIGNPDFSREAHYANAPLPDAGFRLLAVYRFWNIIQYWFPYRDLLEEDWERVLAEFIPEVMAAASVDDYRLTMMRLIARVHDTHANLWRHLDLRPPRGALQLPVLVRFIEGRAVVTGFSHPVLGPATGLQRGDVIERLDGARVDSLVVAWRPYYAASNEAARLRDVARSLMRGEGRAVRVSASRGGAAFEVTAERAPISALDRAAGGTHDLAGETFQMLSDEVAYLKLSSVVGADAADYVRRAADAKVLVIDIRNYPSEFVVFALGQHLIARPTGFARFTRGDPSNPGAFLWSDPVMLSPQQPRFAGSVVILVDEVSQSQAEYTAMAFRAAPDAIVVGSTTAGADGNVSTIPLPGGIESMISGIGVFYPDRSPTQRVGIVPDLEVRPTIAGIREGRDEVLEAGVSRALGREFRLGERPRPR